MDTRERRGEGQGKGGRGLSVASDICSQSTIFVREVKSHNLYPCVDEFPIISMLCHLPALASFVLCRLQIKHELLL